MKKIKNNLVTRLFVCFVVCFLIGVLMNQYKISMPLYTGLLTVLFSLFFVVYYVALKRKDNNKAFYTIILIDLIIFFITYVCFYEIVFLVYDYTFMWQMILLIISSLIVIMNLLLILIYRKNNKINNSEIVYLIGYFAFLFRTMYALFNPISNIDRQHDTIAFTQGGGHLGYIWYIWAYGKIPNEDPRLFWEFYQPPLYYLICGYLAKVYTLLGVPIIQVAENLQLFSLFCVSSTGIVLDELTKRLFNNDKKRVAVSLLFASCPLFLYLAGSVNNDALLVFLFILSIYVAVIWYENNSIWLLLICAVLTGFTVMTKLSGALIAIPLLFLFIFKLVKTKEYKYIWHYILFGIISIPIGLWWNLRNSLLFGMPFVFFDEASHESVQYIPDYSVFERLSSIRNQLNHPYIDMFNTSNNVDHNIFISTLKTLVFTSSWDVEQSTLTHILGWIIFILCSLTSIYILYSVFKVIIKMLHKDKSIKIEYMIMLLLVIISQIIFYLYFNFAHTFVHNMHARYIMPGLIVMLLFCESKNIKYKNERILQIIKGLVIGTYIVAFVGFIMLITLMTYRKFKV